MHQFQYRPVHPHEKDIRVFNDLGMEVFRFGDDGSLGVVLDAAVKKDGRILVLSRKSQKTAILQCNFRGEPQSEITLKNLPPDFAGFVPARLVYRQERLYLLDATAMRIAVTDGEGFFRQGYGHSISGAVRSSRVAPHQTPRRKRVDKFKPSLAGG